VRWRARWISEEPATAAERAARVPLALLAWLYGAATWLHGALHRRGILRTRRLACRVVSVGSPVAGGSAKTPIAAWIASRLRERGHKPVLATRGYGRSGREPVVVLSDGRRVLSHLHEAGDEPSLLVALAPGVPVLVGPDRSVVGLRAVSSFGADVLVLDDGMQHHRLARDVEIVTLDGREGLGNGWVLPRGPLRERLSSLRRADAVVVVDGPLSDRDEARLRRHAPGARRERARRRPRAVRGLEGGPVEPPGWLDGRELGLLSGIARPAGFRRTVESLGGRVVAERIFPDHHPYAPEDLAGLALDAPCWLITEKDAVKILPAWLETGTDLRVLAIALEVESPEPFVDWLHARLR
jgi:tetraacyldisaccharide 4'-kinase